MKEIFGPYRRSTFWVTFILLGVAMLLCANPVSALDGNALPKGGTVTSGSGTINTSGNRMTIDQSSQRLIADWDSFNIGVDASVTFNQPGSSAAALNRISDQSASRIMGSLNANGQVFLLNPSGIIFGATAQVNVGGLAASTLDITDGDFNSGNYTFRSDGSAGSIYNAGTISAEGGYVAFISPIIENRGTIDADDGTVAMVAGDKVSLDLSGDGLITYTIDEGAVDAQIENSGMVRAGGGAVYVTAKARDELASAVVNNSGIIEATGIQNDGGRIMLLAEGGQVAVSGTLDASAEKGLGGSIIATGDSVHIESGAHLNASGATGGGEVLVGGSWQGKDKSVYEATTTIVETGVLLEANATTNGDGGTVVVWSDVNNEDSQTLAYGTFSAMGGVCRGNGGRIETSGHYLDTEGGNGSAAAFKGEAGTWLFDPYDILISDTGADISGDYTATATSTITASSINSLLNNGTSVAISTGSTGTADNGDITVQSAISKTSGGDATLTLQAKTSIIIDADISSTSAALNLDFQADNDADGNGITMLDSDISTNGGYLNFGTGATATVNSVETLVGGDVYVTSSDNTATVINTAGGAVNVYGEMIVANTSGLDITTSGGDVALHGIINSGNTYESVYRSGGINWVNALNQADANDTDGDGSDAGDSYLATITSRLENAIASRAVDYNRSWLGGRRISSTWRWVAGPEGQEDGGSGLPFFQGAGSGGSAIDGAYTNWNSGEPNNQGNETALEFIGAHGRWNDLNRTTKKRQYYVKETNLAASPVTIDAGSGNVTFGGEIGGTKALSTLDVTAGGIAINGESITTEGAQTYNGAVTTSVATSLSAGGDITATNIGNNFSGILTIGNAGEIDIVDRNALTLGEVNATGTIDIATLAGDLTLTGAISTPDSSDGAIILNAGKNADAGSSSGGNIIISGGTFSTGANGRATLYSGSISGSSGLTDLVGSGSGRFRYNSDESQTNYTTALGSGIHAIYRDQPILTFAIDDQEMTYGGTTPDLNYTYSGLLNGDDATTTTTASVGVDALLSSSGNYIAGNHALTIDTFTSTADDLGYSVNISGTGTLAVAQKNVIVSYTAADRTYNGTAEAIVTDSTGNIISGDTVEINETALFDNKNVGTDKTVTVSDISLAGMDASNYNLITESVSTTATITPAALTVTARDAFMEHDELVAYSGGNGVIYNGFVAGEHAAHLDGSLSFTGNSQGAVDVGTYTITPSGLSSDNYIIDFVDGRLIIAFIPVDSGQIAAGQDDEKPVSAGTIQLPTFEDGDVSLEKNGVSLVRFADFPSECEGSVVLASKNSLLVTDFSHSQKTTTLSCNCAAKEELNDIAGDLPVYVGKTDDGLDFRGVYRVKENQDAISLTRVSRDVSDTGNFKERQSIAQSVIFNVSTTDGLHLELTAGIAKDGVLVVSGSNDDVDAMEMERIVLMALQSVKHNLGHSLKSIKAVHLVAGGGAPRTA